MTRFEKVESLFMEVIEADPELRKLVEEAEEPVSSDTQEPQEAA